jgi:hypothetical protein
LAGWIPKAGLVIVLAIEFLAQQGSESAQDAVIIIAWLAGGTTAMLSLLFANYLIFHYLSQRWGFGLRLALISPIVFLATCFIWPLFTLIFPFWAFFTLRNTRSEAPTDAAAIDT